MEVYGNVDALKGAIEKKYSSKIKAVEKEKEKQLVDIGKELKKKIEVLKLQMKTMTDAESKKAYSMILSGEKLKAKKEFEEKRESLIEAVFKEAMKRAKKVAHSDDYMEYVKKNMPDGGLQVVGDSDYYKKEFPGLNVDDSIVGMKFMSDDLIYDVTVDNMITSKKDVLRQEVSKILFG